MGDWTARVALRTRDGIIFVRNKDGKLWHLTGGKKDPTDRDWRVTAVREVHEETGLCVSDSSFYLTRHSHNKRGKKGRYTLRYCTVNVTDQQLTKLRAYGPEGEEIRLFTYGELHNKAIQRSLGPKDFGYVQRFVLHMPV